MTGILFALLGLFLLTGSGIVVLLGTGLLLTVTRLYQKTKSSEAFVRTGLGGARVIRDGGALTIPFVHELTRVSLQTVSTRHRPGWTAFW